MSEVGGGRNETLAEGRESAWEGYRDGRVCSAGFI